METRPIRIREGDIEVDIWTASDVDELKTKNLPMGSIALLPNGEMYIKFGNTPSEWAKLMSQITDDITYTIGSTGDFPTVEAAMDHLRKYLIAEGVTVTLNVIENVTESDINIYHPSRGVKWVIGTGGMSYATCNHVEYDGTNQELIFTFSSGLPAYTSTGKAFGMKPNDPNGYRVAGAFVVKRINPFDNLIIVGLNSSYIWNNGFEADLTATAIMPRYTLTFGTMKIYEGMYVEISGAFRGNIEISGSVYTHNSGVFAATITVKPGGVLSFYETYIGGNRARGLVTEEHSYVTGTNLYVGGNEQTITSNGGKIIVSNIYSSLGRNQIILSDGYFRASSRLYIGFSNWHAIRVYNKADIAGLRVDKTRGGYIWQGEANISIDTIPVTGFAINGDYTFSGNLNMSAVTVNNGHSLRITSSSSITQYSIMGGTFDFSNREIRGLTVNYRGKAVGNNGTINGNVSLYNDAYLYATGATINGTLYLEDRSVAQISNTTINSINAYNKSYCDITNGTINGFTSPPLNTVGNYDSLIRG